MGAAAKRANVGGMRSVNLEYRNVAYSFGEWGNLNVSHLSSSIKPGTTAKSTAIALLIKYFCLLSLFSFFLFLSFAGRIMTTFHRLRDRTTCSSKLAHLYVVPQNTLKMFLVGKDFVVFGSTTAAWGAGLIVALIEDSPPLHCGMYPMCFAQSLIYLISLSIDRYPLVQKLET